MKKQEVIDEIENAIPDYILNDFQIGKETGLTYALELVEELDEPEKPIVPQFVADYIDSEQYSCSTLSEALDNMDDEKRILDWFYINSETFAKAWLYGYEVEKEKLYTVEIPNPHGLGHTVLVKDMYENTYITYTTDSNWREGKVNHLTESEIKKDFPWAWQFKEEVKE